MAANATFSRSCKTACNIARQHVISRSLHPLCAAQIQNSSFTQPCRHNSNHAGITRIQRDEYLRMYPTVLVLPDGSSIKIRYKEPKLIIKLPVDLSSLTAQEMQMRRQKLNPVKKVIIKEEVEDTYDSNEYVNYLQ